MMYFHACNYLYYTSCCWPCWPRVNKEFRLAQENKTSPGGNKTPVALDACRIKRCDHLYSGDETLIRFINYFRRHYWPFARFSSRMRTCGVCPKYHCLVFFYDFRRRIVVAINNFYRILFPMPSEDRDDHDQIEHMLTLILAIDVWWSWPMLFHNISSLPPPPPPLKKFMVHVLYYLLS